ncbi:hypothetical protein J7M23_09605 [Candidatus Sumerlaeota bacterium]|nr:hypothetical protein [Candidatus Sumerlaeota bacterium]
MTLGAHTKIHNVFRSFCRLLAEKIPESELFINWGRQDMEYDELFIPDQKTVWAEVQLIDFPGGQGETPSLVEIHIYSRTEDDPFLTKAQSASDRIIDAANIERAEIYDYSDPTNPQATGYYFYPRFAGMRAGPGIGGPGLPTCKEYILTFRLYHWREGLYP